MVKCLDCDAEINHLKWEQEVTISGKINSSGKITKRRIEPREALWYRCPECDEGLFFYADDVLGFLNGKYSKAILEQKEKRQTKIKLVVKKRA